jgi:hypothetical protein
MQNLQNWLIKRKYGRKKVELCCLMAETGREERGGIPKGDMSSSHLLL